MPFRVKQIGGLYRIIGPNGKIAKTKNGAERDGGGHEIPREAHQQAAAMNEGEKKSGKKRRK